MRRLLWILALSTALAARADDIPYVPEQICCLLEGGHSIDEIHARYGTTTISGDPDEGFYLLHAEGCEDLLELVELMNGDEAVDVADLNWRLETAEGVRQMMITLVGGTWTDFVDQEMTQRIRLDLAHEITRGDGIVVAVLDTGVDPQHQALCDRLTPYGFDCVDFDQTPWESSNGSDDDGDGLIDEGYGHGTMVAGLIALVAPEARIMPIRVLDDEGRGTLFAVAKGIIAACAHGAHVINASFGTPEICETLKRRVRVAHVHEVITVAGAGNRNLEFPPYHPACDSLAIMVTALDPRDVKADFADFGDDVLVSAPGVGLMSAFPGGGWGVGAGCSFATPLVSGEVALVLSRQQTLLLEELRAIVAGAVAPIYEQPGNLAYIGKLGTGRIDLPMALGAPAAAPAARDASLRLSVHPNPVVGAREIRFTLDRAAPWSLEVLDAQGRLLHVGTGAADAPLRWTAQGGDGWPVAPGIYFARVSAAGRVHTAAVTILR